MPRYFFDVHTVDRDVDHDGIVLADTDEARAAAIVYMGDVIRDRPSLLSSSGALQILVQDAKRNALLTVTVTVEEVTRPR